jgi:hypothetical protein
MKNIEDVFLSIDQPITELMEAKAEGLDSIISLYEQEPIKYASLGVVGALAVGQIVAGCLYVAMPNVGTALISEGVGDIINVIRGALTRNFSWEDYAIQKAISLTISFATVGLGQGGMKTAAVEAVDDQIINGARKEGLKLMEKNTTKAVMQESAKIVEKGLISESTNSHLWTASKFVATQLGESTVKEALNYGIDQISNIGMGELRHKITATVENKLQSTFAHKTIEQAVIADKYNKNEIFQNEIQKTANKIIHPKHNKLLSSLSSIGSGILSKNKTVGSYV